tara:strand:- start:1531 stop:1683 length:153 start_codon:yes stop_codon:yes gene_type:complete
VQLQEILCKENIIIGVVVERVQNNLFVMVHITKSNIENLDLTVSLNVYEN